MPIIIKSSHHVKKAYSQYMETLDLNKRLEELEEDMKRLEEDIEAKDQKIMELMKRLEEYRNPDNKERSK